jgi:hypothetical protein
MVTAENALDELDGLYLLGALLLALKGRVWVMTAKSVEGVRC